MTAEIRCPRCASENVIFSKKRNLHVCEDCDHEFVLEKPFTPKRVFLSYGRDEHALLAERLNRDLTARGHEVWFDGDRLQPGHDWEAFIEKGLEHLAADRANAAVVLLLTPHSVRRPDGYCLNEVARALSLGLKIIPLMVVESEPPLSICRIQWLDMRECIPIQEKEAFYRPRFERLLKALEEGQLDFEGTQQRLLKALQPLEFEADILRHLPKFTGRRWVFDAVEKWLKDPPKQRVFWISGLPGVGKTAISAVLSSRYLEVAALHLCKFGHAQKSDPRRVVTSLVYQLSTQLPEYEARLAAMDVERLAQDDARTLFDNLLVQPLAKLNPPNRAIVILIDALDEATSDEHNSLASFMAAEFPKTPEWLRLIITARPEKAVTAPLQGLNPFVLDTEIEANRADLRGYLRRELAQLLEGRTDTEHIIEHVVAHSEGVFLYVERVCDDLQRGNLSPDRLDQFPQGLGGVFWQFFERQFPDLEEFRKNVRPALRAILAAREPLPTDILQRLFDWKEEELRDFTRSLGSLFPEAIENGVEVIKPYHKSLADWLTDEAKAGRYFVSVAEGHRHLAEYFGSLPLWLGDEKARNPNLRKCAELPYQQTQSGAMWPELVATLTDPEFVDAKSRAGMVYDLLADYNRAQAALPEGLEETRRDEERQQRIKTYVDKLIDHARNPQANPLPDPPQAVEIKGTRSDSGVRREWSPLERVKAWGHFAGTHIRQLAAGEEPIFQMAWNSSAAGPVAERVAEMERQGQGLSREWIRLGNRPPFTPNPACLKMLEGHRGSVWAVAITPDGRRAVSGGMDRTLRLWDLGTGECLTVLDGHADSVTAVSITPDGGTAVSGSDDKTLRVWDLATGECVKVLEGHTSLICAVSVAADGRHAVSGSGDNTLRVWNLATGHCSQVLKGHANWVRAVSVTPSGRRAASGSRDRTVRAWDLATGDCLQVFEGHTDSVTAVSVTSDGRTVVSGSDDRTVRVWDLATGKCLKVLEGHTNMVAALAITPKGDRAVSGGWDNTLRVWDLVTGDCLQVLEGHTDDVHAVSMTPDAGIAISASRDEVLRVWNMVAGECLQAPESHALAVNDVSIFPDGGRAASGSWDKTVRVWDLATGECLRVLQGHTNSVSSVSVTPDGGKGVSGSDDKTLRVWELATGTCLRVLEGHTNSVTAISTTPDGWRAISGSRDNSLCVWDLATGERLNVLEGHGAAVNVVSIAPDGRRAVSGSNDNALRVWDLATGVCLGTLEGHKNSVTAISITPDGGRALSGSRDRCLCVWDLTTGRCLKALEGHTDSVTAISIIPDGGTMVSGSDDNTLRVWDLATGRCLKTLEWHTGSVTAISVTADGGRAAAVSRDNALRVWDLTTGERVAIRRMESAIRCTAVYGNALVAGESNGRVDMLTIEGYRLGTPVVTAARLWLFDQQIWDSNLTAQCYWCGRRFIVKDEWIGQEIDCPLDGCGKSIRLNPFACDNSDWLK